MWSELRFNALAARVPFSGNSANKIAFERQLTPQSDPIQESGYKNTSCKQPKR
jgi:hypothetical protein